MPDGQSEAESWLDYAREDFAHSQLGADAFPRSAAWGFQQAAEKALKAVFIANRRAVPRTHDLAFLLSALAERNTTSVLPFEDVLALATISPAIRYPGDWPALEPEDIARLATAAARVMAWAEQEIADAKPNSSDEKRE
jgi:HEPN domain-containing protein